MKNVVLITPEEREVCREIRQALEDLFGPAMRYPKEFYQGILITGSKTEALFEAIRKYDEIQKQDG